MHQQTVRRTQEDSKRRPEQCDDQPDFKLIKYMPQLPKEASRGKGTQKGNTDGNQEASSKKKKKYRRSTHGKGKPTARAFRARLARLEEAEKAEGYGEGNASSAKLDAVAFPGPLFERPEDTILTKRNAPDALLAPSKRIAKEPVNLHAERASKAHHVYTVETYIDARPALGPGLAYGQDWSGARPFHAYAFQTDEIDNSLMDADKLLTKHIEEDHQAEQESNRASSPVPLVDDYEIPESSSLCVLGKLPKVKPVVRSPFKQVQPKAAQPQPALPKTSKPSQSFGQMVQSELSATPSNKPQPAQMRASAPATRACGPIRPAGVHKTAQPTTHPKKQVGWFQEVALLATAVGRHSLDAVYLVGPHTHSSHSQLRLPTSSRPFSQLSNTASYS